MLNDCYIGETQSGFRVRVTNLPKKKNVHRDLKAAFKEVSGVLGIEPAVSGNKKTKDPVCKGFALVDFRSEVDANRYCRLAFLLFGDDEDKVLVFFCFLGLWSSSMERDYHLGRL